MKQEKYSQKEIFMFFEKNSSEFYKTEKKNEYKKNMLIIAPELKMGGAMITLLEIIPLIHKNGYCVYCITSENGEFLQEMLELGVNVSVREYVHCNNDFRYFLQHAFDKVFINSAVCSLYAYYFINTEVPVIWWFHETETQFESMLSYFPHLGLLGTNFRFEAVTQSVIDGIKQLFGVTANHLPMPVADCRVGLSEPEGELTEVKSRPFGYTDAMIDKKLFFIPAGYTSIKGQDILLSAISKLPQEFASKAHFVFCGYILQDDYYRKLKGLGAKLSNVTILENLDKKEVYRWYNICDCMVAPSRIDATPTTVVEAMMFGKLCVVSNAAGISYYLKDLKDALIFPSGDVTALMARIMLVIEGGEQMKPIAAAGRKVYEQYFRPDAVLCKLKEFL